VLSVLHYVTNETSYGRVKIAPSPFTEQNFFRLRSWANLFHDFSWICLFHQKTHFH